MSILLILWRWLVVYPISLAAWIVSALALCCGAAVAVVLLLGVLVAGIALVGLCIPVALVSLAVPLALLPLSVRQTKLAAWRTAAAEAIQKSTAKTAQKGGAQ